MVGSLAITIIGGIWFTPHWSSVCERITVGKPCEPIATASTVGYFTIGLGALTMIFGPIIGSLLDLMLHGYNLEASRVETAASNLPILAGLLLLVTGVLIAASA